VFVLSIWDFKSTKTSDVLPYLVSRGITVNDRLRQAATGMNKVCNTIIA
jgi:hypothetical protein